MFLKMLRVVKQTSSQMSSAADYEHKHNHAVPTYRPGWTYLRAADTAPTDPEIHIRNEFHRQKRLAAIVAGITPTEIGPNAGTADNEEKSYDPDDPEREHEHHDYDADWKGWRNVGDMRASQR